MISSILSSPLIATLLGGVVAAVMAYLRGRSSGAQRERARQAAKDMKAAEDRLEMDREASDAERKATGMSDEEARREAMRWNRQ